jgi:hypothetical protein
MADSAKVQRLALNDAKAARHTLARLVRMRFRSELDSATFRDLVYSLHCMLGFDKLQKETELERRLAGLENKCGQIVLNVTPEENVGITDYSPEERDAEIRKLLEKSGYLEKNGYTKAPEAGTEPAISVAAPAPDPVPPAPEAREPQPRRLRL